METTTSSPSSASPSRVARVIGRVLVSPTAVFLLALIARFKALSDLLPLHAWDYYRYNEPSHIAWALVSGFGYSAPWPNTPIAPTAQQPPLYPLLVAGVFKVLGAYTYQSLCVLLVLNAIFSATTAIMILRLGRRSFGVVPAVVATWVWSCWVYESVVSVRLWESSLSTLLLMVGWFFLLKLTEKRIPKLWVLFGGLAGIAALSNTTLLLVFSAFWVYLWLKYRQRRESCMRLLLCSIVACVFVMAPWTVRNYVVFHRIMPVRDNFGLELWIGVELAAHADKARTGELFTRDFPLSDPSEYNRMGELAFMESRGRMARQAILQQPLAYVEAAGIRFLKYWTQPTGSPWLLISGLAWVGAALFLRHKGLDALPCLITLICFPLVYYITHTFPTYRHVIEPFILLMAAYAATSSVQVFARQIGPAHV